MKLLRIIKSLNPELGGPVHGIKNITPALSKLSIETTLLTLDSPEDPWIADYDGTVTALGDGQGVYGYSASLKPWLHQHVKNYDAVILHGIWEYPPLAAYRICKKNKIPYYIYTHGMLDPWFKERYPLKHLKKWLYWPWGTYRILRDAKAVFFTSQEEMIQARKSFWLYKCNEVVVKYGITKPCFDSDSAKEQFSTLFPNLESKKILLFLSRIHPKKGLDLLLNALGQVIQESPDLHLIIAGPPEDKIYVETLKRLIHQLNLGLHVTWTGMLEGNLKWGAFLKADLFVLPSHQENFGISVAEALSCKVPVLITDKVNIWREIKEDQAGLISQDNVESLIQALKEWTHLDKNMLANIKDKAYDSFLKRFEIKESAKFLTDLFTTET